MRSPEASGLRHHMASAPASTPTAVLHAACAWVAERSASVRIREALIPKYACSFQPRPEAREGSAAAPAAREADASFWLTLDAINFGSGWFPTLRKGPHATGYRTIAAGVRRRFEDQGRFTASQLAAIEPAELARWLGQDPGHELIALMAASLRDLGANVRRLYGGSFAALVDAADGSAVSLVQTLAAWRSFEDVSHYDGRAIPFLKRAQLAAADLHRNGVAHFRDLGELTMFADNLVPHVLRLDGILWFEPDLVERIARGELLEHGSPEEVEIRACAVHAVELLVAAAAAGGTSPAPSAAQIDEILWNRGQQPRYKALPRHRSRSTAY